jgi:hypothetical protein
MNAFVPKLLRTRGGRAPKLLRSLTGTAAREERRGIFLSTIMLPSLKQQPGIHPYS